MTTYPNYVLEIDSTTGTNVVPVVAPPSGRAQLVQALRMSLLVTVFETGTTPYTMDLSLKDSGGVRRIFDTIQIPPNESIVQVDMMGFLSNLAAYGISNPNEFAVQLSAPLQGSDHIDFYGFGIEGLDD